MDGDLLEEIKNYQFIHKEFMVEQPLSKSIDSKLI
jgi:hypothetical protein